VGSSTHLALELFKSLAGVTITHIPYSGSPQVVTDMLANRIQGYFSPASTVSGHIAAGKLVALAVTDAKRSIFFPNLPTMIEAGVPDCESVLWFGIEAPAGTPQPIVDKLNAEIAKILAMPDLKERFAAGGAETLTMTSAALDTRVRADTERLKQIVEKANMKPD
jgi:tripartite-type tricarboxylate transporter receptor subunit TctC